MTRDVFISHSSQDKGPADVICSYLERHGIRCWMAPRDIRPGTPYPKAIIRAIGECRSMVVVFSARADSSVHVLREVERAISKSIPVIPLRIEDVHPSEGMEYCLGGTHWLDGFPGPLEERLGPLQQVLSELLGVVSPPKFSPVGEEERKRKAARFVKDDLTGVIREQRTNLEWIVGPDLDTNYDAAERWIASQQDTAGGGWRMPTETELRSIYLPESSNFIKLVPLFETTGWVVWAEPRD